MGRKRVGLESEMDVDVAGRKQSCADLYSPLRPCEPVSLLCKLAVQAVPNPHLRHRRLATDRIGDVASFRACGSLCR